MTSPPLLTSSTCRLYKTIEQKTWTCAAAFILSQASVDCCKGNSGPVHACRAGSSLYDVLETFLFSLSQSHSLSLNLSFSQSLSLSDTLFSQRCCAEGNAGKVPFPSISGRLQRSIKIKFLKIWFLSILCRYVHHLCDGWVRNAC